MIAWDPGMGSCESSTLSKGIVNATFEALNKACQSAVLLGDQLSDWFPTKVGIRQGCLLSPSRTGSVLRLQRYAKRANRPEPIVAVRQHRTTMSLLQRVEDGTEPVLALTHHL